MLTPPPYSLGNYLMNERNIKIFIKANSRFRREGGKKEGRSYTVSANSLSNKSFAKLAGKKAEEKLILSPQKIQERSQDFLRENKLERNDDISRSSDRITTSRQKKHKNIKKVENFAGLQNLLNELLIDKKYKCTKCLKCICECPDKVADSQSRRLKPRGKSDLRPKVLSKPKPSGHPVNDIQKKPNTETDLCILNRRKISFSLIHDQSYSAIHSNSKNLKKPPIKKRCNTARKERKNESEIDLIISISPVCFSNRLK